MKALIVDGEELFRLSLKEVVAAAGSFSDIIEVGSEHEFLAKTATHTDLSLIVLHTDSLLNQKEDWIKLTRRLYPSVSIVVISNKMTGSTQKWFGVTTLPRTTSISDLIVSLRKALRLPTGFQDYKDRTPENPNIAKAMENEFSRFQKSISSNEPAIDLTRLSYRQKQILAMAADGLANKEIAARLTIAEGTVKAHMHAIFKVLGVSNRTQAVIRYGASGNHIASETIIPTDTVPPQQKVIGF